MTTLQPIIQNLTYFAIQLSANHEQLVSIAQELAKHDQNGSLKSAIQNINKIAVDLNSYNHRLVSDAQTLGHISTATSTIVKVPVNVPVLTPVPSNITISVVNQSAHVTTAEAQHMVDAINLLFPKVGDAWNMLTPKVVLTTGTPPANHWVMTLTDATPDQQGTVAYHTENNDQVQGLIYAAFVVQNNGGVLTGSFNVAQALSHEIFEAFCNPTVNTWWQSGDQTTLYSGELVDPVEGDVVTISTDGVSVDLSNFILPKWRDPEAVTGPFDYLKKLTAPFTMSSGGYVVQATISGENEIFGEKMPDWVKKMKQSSKRYVKLKDNARNVHKH